MALSISKISDVSEIIEIVRLRNKSLQQRRRQHERPEQHIEEIFTMPDKLAKKQRTKQQ